MWRYIYFLAFVLVGAESAFSVRDGNHINWQDDKSESNKTDGGRRNLLTEGELEKQKEENKRHIINLFIDDGFQLNLTVTMKG